MPAWLSERCLIRVSGADAASFLQNLVTNDVNREGLTYSCLLTPQGRFLHDFFMSHDGGGFYLECETARREDLMRRLTVYKLRARVTIEDCHGKFHVYAAEKAPSEVQAFADPRLPQLGYRFYLPAGKTLSASVPESYHNRRIALGIPEGSPDMKPEVDTVTDVNLDQLNAISWDKGCYVGQEVTARMNNRGLAKKRMVIARGAKLEAGSPLTQEGHGVGEIRSVASTGTTGLAILKLSVLDSGAAPVVQPNGDIIAAELPSWLET